jgi:hypothetical protein
MVCFYVAFSIYLLAQRAGRREREIGVRCKLHEQLGQLFYIGVCPQ